MPGLYVFALLLAVNLALRFLLRPLGHLRLARESSALAGLRPLSAPLGFLTSSIAVQCALATGWLPITEAAAWNRQAGTFVVVGAAWLSVRLVSLGLARVYFGCTRPEAVPRARQRLLDSGLYLAAGLLVMHYRSGYAAGDLIISLSVVVLVLGVALQGPLSNLLAGLSVSLGQHFQDGDFVRVGDIEGCVVQSDWRTTTLRRRTDDLVTVPNRLLAEAPLVNYSRPVRQQRAHVAVPVSSSEQPNRVLQVLAQCALRTHGVLRQPPPEAWVDELGPRFVRYAIWFSVDDYAREAEVAGRLQLNVWYALRRHGLALASRFPGEERLRASLAGDAETGDVVGWLSGVPLFRVLGARALTELETHARLERYGDREFLFRQGDDGDCLYLVRRGAIEVTIDDAAGGERVVGVIEPGGFCGEMSLLTGENRSANARAIHDTEVIVVDKGLMQRLLSENPGLAEQLSEVVAQRSRALAAHSLPEPTIERASFLDRMRRFFDLAPRA